MSKRNSELTVLLNKAESRIKDENFKPEDRQEMEAKISELRSHNEELQNSLDSAESKLQVEAERVRCLDVQLTKLTSEVFHQLWSSGAM